MAGTMRSRFSDFLTTDGEKPDRNRDQEFIVATDASRAEIMATWEKHWQLVLDTVTSLKSEDLLREVTIRREPHSVLQAINRQVAHYSLHMGQIIFLAKHLKGSAWKTLSVARGQSDAVNAAFAARVQSK
jgi:glutathionylspermidine synthase